VSLFEDDHPNEKKLYHVVILHRGDDSKPLLKSEEIIGDIFKLKVYVDN